MSTLPPLPKLDPKLSIPYESIRYIAGYAESTVHVLMTEYAQQAVAAERERCAVVAETLPWIDGGRIPSGVAIAAAIRNPNTPTP